jgi:hypothetical protein
MVVSQEKNGLFWKKNILIYQHILTKMGKNSLILPLAGFLLKYGLTTSKIAQNTLVYARS